MTTQPDSHLTVFINGESERTRAGATLATLLQQRGISEATPGVAVALGDHVIRRADWATTAIPDGARIEIVTAVQGG